MTLWSRVKAFLLAGAPKSAGGLLAGIMQGGVAPKRGTRELLRAYKQVPWLRAVVGRINQDVASTPLVLYRPSGSAGAKQRARRYLLGRVGPRRQEQLRRMAEWGDVEPVEKHPALDVLRTWNPALGRSGSLIAVQAWRDLKGEAPIVIERGADGLPLELWPIPPHWLLSLPTISVPGYRFSWQSWQRIVPEADVIYARNVDPENPYARGAGIGEALADEIDIDEYAAQHIKSFFFNRAMPDVFVSMENATPAEVERFRAVLLEKYQGRGRGHQIHPTNLKLSVQEVGQTFKEQQLVELRGAGRDTFIQVYGVPPEVVGVVENSNRATIDAADFLYAKRTLCPRMDAMCDTLQPVVDEWDDGLVLGYDSPVEEDRAFQKDVMLSKPELFTKNEIRALASMPPVEGWDDEFAEPAMAASPFGAPALPAGDEPNDDDDEQFEEEEEDDVERGRSLRQAGLHRGRHRRRAPPAAA